ncbi:hypothetical protein G7085_20695 [Tessaracoccus sp. HDW20]|uniref:hypothetical protein n=1 Tax=Tessaracoccus coleopterorum TaxID=2714950 RepID=UPI0018D2A631|nr:hypothetical protein [Tessaracoccus coleopterorum]NHB86123.1 hypothetical protein [Tessaracoccus coleopterorum]
MHRLAGKLGTFGYRDAGEAARVLLSDLQGLNSDAVVCRIDALIRLLGADGEPAA